MGPLPLKQRTIDILTLLVVVAACAWILSFPLRSHQILLDFAQDDFYYYLKPAQNLAAGRGVTFDGTTRTNGFHPLYFLLLTAASFFIHSLRAIFRLLWAVDLLSATAIFVLLRSIYARLTTDPFLPNALALCVLLPCLRTLFMQMEVTLALPLAFAFLATAFVPPQRYSPSRCAALGFLAALTMLARLDAGILVLMFLIGLVLVSEYRSVFTRRNMASFAITSLPLPLLYFFINQHFFHQLLPVSGSAKQLRHGWFPSHEVVSSFHGTSLLLITLAAASVTVGWSIRRHLRPQEKLFCITALSTPFFFFTVEMFLSDWKLWGWYLYALRFAASASFLLFGIIISSDVIPAHWELVRQAAHRRWLPPALYAASLFLLVTSHYKMDVFMVEIQQAALRLNSFQETHPGKYAMGDRAGMFGYLSASPVLQAEGLMMDRTYLNHIRAQEDLRSVLASYGVNYYVAFTETKKESKGSCFHATEPVIAGPDALRMRSEFCDPPVFQFKGFDGTYRVFRLASR